MTVKKVTYRPTGPGAKLYSLSMYIFSLYAHVTIIKHLLTYLLYLSWAFGQIETVT